jgi:hypothetical protein
MLRALRRRAAGATLLMLVAMVALPGWASSHPHTPEPFASPSEAVQDTSTPWFEIRDGDVRVHLYFGWSSTCPHCAAARPFISDLPSRYPWLVLDSLQVDGDNAGNRERLVALADAIGETLRVVPAFLYAGQLRVGWASDEETGEAIERELVSYRDCLQAAVDGGVADPGAACSIDGSFEVPGLGAVTSLPLLTVLLAGLDAVNPCALSVLLFLLSLLVGARDRRRMLIVGGTFVLVSGAAYFVLMAAWLNVFLLVGMLRIVTIAAGIAAIAAALINIKDYAWFRRGPSLVIPERAKPMIFGRMIELTESTRLSVMLAGTVLVAIAANAYEALCTGGFPVVFTRILTLNDLSTPVYYAYLAAYVLVYVSPLVAMVLFFTWTLGSHSVTRREARTLKLLSGLLMLGFGLMLLLAPDLLGSLAATIGLFVGAVLLTALAVLVDRARAGPPTTLPARG